MGHPNFKLFKTKLLIKMVLIMEAPNINFEKSKVLIVDDAALSRNLLRSLLTNIGFREIEECNSADIACEVIKKNVAVRSIYSMIFIDWMMPGMDGLELVKRIRQIPELNNTKLIMVSSEGGSENILKAIEYGVHSFVTKPVTKEVLIRKIHFLVNS